MAAGTAGLGQRLAHSRASVDLSRCAGKDRQNADSPERGVGALEAQHSRFPWGFLRMSANRRSVAPVSAWPSPYPAMALHLGESENRAWPCGVIHLSVPSFCHTLSAQTIVPQVLPEHLLCAWHRPGTPHSSQGHGACLLPPSEGQIKEQSQMNQQLLSRKQAKQGTGASNGWAGRPVREHRSGGGCAKLSEGTPGPGRSSALFVKGNPAWLEHHVGQGGCPMER